MQYLTGRRPFGACFDANEHQCCFSGRLSPGTQGTTDRRRHTWRRPSRRCVVASLDPVQQAVDDLVAPQVTSKPLALKEWAPICEALGNGDQLLVIRKGGIKEPTFRPAAAKFLLFPTGYHTDEDLLQERFRLKYAKALHYDPKSQPTLELRYGAEHMSSFVTKDPAVLRLSTQHHIMGPDFLDARLNWKPQLPLTVMQLRVWRLAKPIVLVPQDRFWGCFSWLNLSEEIQGKEWMEGTPVLRDDVFWGRHLDLELAFSRLQPDAGL